MAKKPSYCVICLQSTVGAKLCGLHRQMSPASQLQFQLRRLRDESGYENDFDGAWDIVMGQNRIAWPHNTEERLTWKRILGVELGSEATLADHRAARRMKESWRAAFFRAHKGRRERAVSNIELVA